MTDVTLALLQGGDAGLEGMLVILIQLVLLVVVIAGMWKTFEKAGEPGWASIVPIYNMYVLIRISGNDWWWLFLLVIPILNVLIFAKINIDLADRFGQGLLFGLGLWLFGFIFLPLLGFGDYQYQQTAT